MNFLHVRPSATLRHVCLQYSIFKIAVFFSWLVVVSGPEHIEDIRKATNDQMTFFDALDKVLGRLIHRGQLKLIQRCILPDIPV
jgi:hypothetical protein